MDPRRIYRLDNHVQSYDWGSRSAIQELLGVAPSSEPWAELWMGAHPSAPSRVLTPTGPVALDTWIARDPEGVLGPSVARRFGGELPFLMKLLAAERPLSIQAHPNAEQARSGFERENAAGLRLDARERCYRDPHPKPELICALTPFCALNRFREPDEIARRLKALGVPALTALAEPLLEAPDRNGLRAFFEAWMKRAPEERRARVAEAAQAADGSTDPARALLCRLAASHPGDAGVLAPLFLNLVELAPGEAMFLPAGELHSYLGGLAVELMASSDNVLRGGLTTKHVDLTELLRVLSFESGVVEVLSAVRADPVESRYATPVREFALSVLELRSGLTWQAPPGRGPEILLCTRGELLLTDAEGRDLRLPRGGSALAPAGAGRYAVSGDGVAHRALVAPEISA